nr:PREDICTED: uncharacterized protein LOC109042155 isoform X2 [Bemisia tabaci]
MQQEKTPALTDEKIFDLFQDGGNSPASDTTQMLSPEKSENSEKIEDTDISNDSADIFERVRVSSSAKAENSSALGKACGVSPKNLESPVSRGRSSLFANDSILEHRNPIRPFGPMDTWSSRLKNSSLKSQASSSTEGQFTDVDFFKQKSKWVPVKFTYETTEIRKKKQSAFFINPNLPLEKRVEEFTKSWDQWVCTYLSQTQDLPDSKKLPFIDTSRFNVFERAKTPDQRKGQKTNPRPQTNNGRKPKNQNQIIDERSNVSVREDGGWVSRNKPMYERGNRKSLDEDHNQIKEKRQEKTSPYEFSEDEDKPGTILKGVESTKGSKAEQSKSFISEGNKSNPQLDVEFNFNKRLMDESSSPKPNQRLFKEALARGSERKGSRDETHQNSPSGSAWQNNEGPIKGRDSSDFSRGGGRGNSGGQDSFNGTPRASPSNADDNHQQVKDSDSMACPICSMEFKMGNELENHVDRCLMGQTEPIVTRSRDQSNAPDIDSSDEETSSIVPPKKERR